MPPSDAASNDALGAQLRRLDQKFDALQSTQSAARNTNRIISGLIAIVAIGLVVRLIEPLYSAYTERDKYIKQFQKEANDRAVPLLKAELEKAGKKLAPAYQAAVESEFKKRQEKAEKILAHEYDQFFVTLQDGMSKTLATRIERIVDSQHARLIKEFPELATDTKSEETLEHLDRCIHQAAERVFAEDFQTPMQALMDLNATFEQFPIPDNVRNMTDEQLQSHLIDAGTELLNEKFRAEVELGKEMSGKAMELMNQKMGTGPAAPK